MKKVIFCFLLSIMICSNVLAESKPSWILNIKDTNSHIYGVGYGNYSSLANSKTAADLNAKKEIARKISDRLSLLSNKTSNSLYKTVITFCEEQTEVISSFIFQHCSIKERWTGPEGDVWTLAVLKKDELGSIVREAAERKKNELLEKIDLVEQQYKELQDALNVAAEQGLEKRNSLIEEYTKIFNSIDPNQYSEVIAAVI